MGHVVKVDNKGITLHTDKEVEEFLRWFGYENPVAKGKGKYAVDTIGDELPAITVIDNKKSRGTMSR